MPFDVGLVLCSLGNGKIQYDIFWISRNPPPFTEFMMIAPFRDHKAVVAFEDSQPGSATDPTRPVCVININQLTQPWDICREPSRNTARQTQPR